jgi:hypothetical protein
MNSSKKDRHLGGDQESTCNDISFERFTWIGSFTKALLKTMTANPNKKGWANAHPFRN